MYAFGKFSCKTMLHFWWTWKDTYIALLFLLRVCGKSILFVLPTWLPQDVSYFNAKDYIRAPDCHQPLFILLFSFIFFNSAWKSLFFFLFSVLDNKDVTTFLLYVFCVCIFKKPYFSLANLKWIMQLTKNS